MRQFAPSTIGMLDRIAIGFNHAEHVSLTNEGLAGDIASTLREKIDGRIRNIANVSEATKRLGLGVGSLSVGWEQTLQALDRSLDRTLVEMGL